MTGEFKIIKANIEDKEAIVALLLRQFEEHVIETSLEQLKRVVDEVLHNESYGLFLLAREDGRAIGVSNLAFTWTLEHGGKSAWLDELYVQPKSRGNGIGTALLRAALETAQEYGCAAVDLEVDEAHARAESLYIRSGFRHLNRSRWVKKIRKKV